MLRDQQHELQVSAEIKKQYRRLTQFIADANSLIDGQGTVTILTVGHDWAEPLVDVAPHLIDERRAVAKQLVRELGHLQREWLGRMSPRDLQARMDAIAHVLVKPAFGPSVQVQNAEPKPTAVLGAARFDLGAAFARRSPPRAINIGFEVEGNISVEGRHKGSSDVVVGLLIKCMVDELPAGRDQGFSVQTDGGRIELVSDSPRRPLDPVETAAAMAKYVGELRSRLLSLQKRSSLQSRKWQPARMVVPPFDRHLVAVAGGGTSELEVRFKADTVGGAQVSGMFHITAGVHLSAIPWLFSTIQEEALTSFPLPGKAFRHNEVRKMVLDQLHELRKAASVGRQPWPISPQFEGLAFLILTYVATAQQLNIPPQHRSTRVLSPKQLFLVLARTDFATMLKLCPEFVTLGTDSRSRRRLKTYRDLLLGVMASADTTLFTNQFGRAQHPNQLAIPDPSDLDLHDLHMTPEQWLTNLFNLRNPVDILTPQFQNNPGNSLPGDLFRGMGELGAKVDQIPGPIANRPVSAPILELRELTIGDKGHPEWEAFASHIVDVVSELNCPAYASDKDSAAEELEWIRLAGRPRVQNPGQNGRRVRTTDADLQAVDQICAQYRLRMRDATMRADLWTLLDQARSHIEARPRARRN